MTKKLKAGDQILVGSDYITVKEDGMYVLQENIDTRAWMLGVVREHEERLGLDRYYVEFLHNDHIERRHP